MGKRLRRLVIATACAALFGGPFASSALATHGRYFNITWKKISATSTSETVQFTVTAGFRRTYYTSAGVSVNMGSTVNTGYSLVFGSRYPTQAPVDLTVTAINTANDWFVGTTQITHTYGLSQLPDSAYLESCCTLSTLRNAHDQNFRAWTLVTTADTESPTTSLPPLFTIADNGAQSWPVPAADSGGQTLTWRLATNVECGGCGQPNPPGLTIDPSTGQVSWTTSPSLDGTWLTNFVIEAHDPATNAIVSSTSVESLVQVASIGTNQPPAWETPTRPAGTIAVNAGETVTLPLQATDPNSGDLVHIDHLTLPTGATFQSSDAHTATGSFSWTPTTAQVGDVLVTFTAEDNRFPALDAPPLTYDLHVTGPPAAFALAPPSTTTAAGTDDCVSATVADSAGNPSAGADVVFAVTGTNPSPASSTQVTDSSGDVSFCYTPTVAGADTVHAFVDTNGNGTEDAGELSSDSTDTVTAGDPASISASGPSSPTTAGQQACVTVTVTDAYGNPESGIGLAFAVTGGNPQAASEQGAGENGVATYCYTGTVAGTDTVIAFIDENDNGTVDAGELAGSAAVTYVAATPATLSLSSGASTAAGQQECVTASVADQYGNPTGGVAVVFSVGGANAQAPTTVPAGSDGNALYCYTGTHAGGDTIAAFADTSGNGAQDAGEPGGTSSATYVAAAPSRLTLTPATATSVLGGQHCVTATVADAYGNPNQGVSVAFSVTGAAAAAGTKATEASGAASWCYASPAWPGTDAIAAYADTNGNSTQDAGEPSGTAAMTWTLPASTPGAKVTFGGTIRTSDGTRASFGGNAQAPSKGQITYTAGALSVSFTRISAVLRSGATTTVFGTAAVAGGGSVAARVDATDNGEPGRDDVFRLRLSDGYDSGAQTLTGGNVQSH